MPRSTVRWRVGIALVMAAGVAIVGAPLVTSATTEPPSTVPESSSAHASTPDGSAPALDPERQTIVNQIVTYGKDFGFPYDADCIAGVVAQIPDEEIPLVAELIAQGLAAIPSPVPDDESAATEATTVTIVLETIVTEGSLHVLSPETLTLGQELNLCLRGDADPALVDEALAVFSEDEAADGFDLECVAAVMSTIDDETLQQIIDNADGALTTEVPEPEEPGTEVARTDVAGTDVADLLPVTNPEIEVPPIEGLEDALPLLACNLSVDIPVAGSNSTATTVPEPVESVSAPETTG
jgi:hypothetical protein